MKPGPIKDKNLTNVFLHLCRRENQALESLLGVGEHCGSVGNIARPFTCVCLSSTLCSSWLAEDMMVALAVLVSG